MLTLPVHLRLGGKIEEGEQFKAATGLRLGGETDSELDIDPIWSENNVLVVALKDGFAKLVSKLLYGVGKWNLHLWVSFLESIASLPHSF